MRVDLRAVRRPLAVLIGGVIAVYAFGVPSTPLGLAEEPVYQEQIIQPIPDVGHIPSAAYDPTEDCGCTSGTGGGGHELWLPPNRVESSPYYLSAFGGGSYFDSALDTSLGGMYGLDFAVPIAGQWGAGASGSINHYSGGSQYWLNLGAYRWSTYYGDFRDRIGTDLSVSQFTDTGLGSPYYVTGSAEVTYKLLPGVRAGLDYNFPIHGDNTTVLLPGGGIAAGNIRPLEEIAAYIQAGGVARHIQASLGYVDKLNTVTYGLAIARPLNQRASLSFSTNYDQEPGLWTGFLGLNFDLSPAPSHSRFAAGTSSDVVRGAAFSTFSALSFDDSLNDLSGLESDTEKNNREMRERDNRAHREIEARRTAELRKTGGGGGGGGGGGCNCPPGTTFVANSPPFIICQDAMGGFVNVSCP